MIRYANIHIRLMMAAIVLMSASTLAFFAGVNILSRFTQERYDERINFMARYLASNAELGILIGDRIMLARLAGNMLNQQDIVRVVITGGNDQILADESAAPASSPPKGSAVFLTSVPVIIQNTTDDSQPFLLGASPLRSGEIGKVTIHYTVDGIRAMIEKIKGRFYLLSVGLVSLSLLMFLLLSHYLVKPVRELVITARRVAAGNLNSRATPGNLPETRELALAFNAMLDSLARSNAALARASREMVRQKTLAELGKFSLMIAHEVKNPLGIIKSSLDILKQDMSLSSDNTMVAFIEDEIERLNRMIEGFLEFARPASPSLREVDMNELLQDCVMRFEVQTLGREDSFHLDLPQQPPLMYIDPDLMIRVLDNIIKNALEASGEKATISIQVTFSENGWCCRIRDQGPGIDELKKERIFEPFVTTKITGTGLGLAFAKQVVSAHNGTISAENNPGGGACFSITLPLEKPGGEVTASDPRGA